MVEKEKQAKKEAIIDLDISKPIDLEASVTSFSGNTPLYIGILTRFEEVSLTTNMESMSSYVVK